MHRTSLLLGTALTLISGAALAETCPQATVADMKGLAGAFPQQFELAEMGCDLAFAENPSIAALNSEIEGNPELPPVAERLPAEPLVVAPYSQIGSYGGTLDGLSKGTESGTSDLLSVRHVNLVRYADDLQTIVPNVAKAWEWNDDFTQLSFTLRKGHKWSDGAPFTAEDVVFWYNNLILNKSVYEKTPDRWLFGGEPAKVEALDDLTVRFTMAAPAPGLLNRFAVDYGQTFQPKHFLGQFIGAGADEAAAKYGLASGAEALAAFYAGSDWKDVPTPLLKNADIKGNGAANVTPTLESHIVVEETAEGRKLVANPYFHMVDTAGNQLPYIDRISETYVGDKEVQNLKIMNGEVDWKQQAIFLEDFPLLKENEGKGDYTIAFAPTFGENVFYSFNRTVKDDGLRAIFNDVRFNRAMSLAMNRAEINEVVYLGQGTPMQGVPAEHKTVEFVTDEQLNRDTAYDPDAAKALLDEMGLKDVNGDGLRERADGSPLVIRLVYSSQGAPVKLHELMRGYWADVGIRVDLKEVTSDEYRANGNNNDLDLTTWKYDGNAAPTLSQDATVFFPPFGDVFNPGTGFGWAAWHDTDGAQGIEPPEDIKKLWDLSQRFVQVPMGSEESNAIGAEITEIHVGNMLKIGTVGDIVAPFLHHNTLKNVQPLTAKTYDYYWAYPYRPQQWFIAD